MSEAAFTQPEDQEEGVISEADFFKSTTKNGYEIPPVANNIHVPFIDMGSNNPWQEGKEYFVALREKYPKLIEDTIQAVTISKRNQEAGKVADNSLSGWLSPEAKDLLYQVYMKGIEMGFSRNDIVD